MKDLSIAKDIADTVDVCPDLPILEVGPGMGVLTQFIMQKNRPVKVVELDYESVAYLRENFPALEDNIIEDDFLKLNLEKLFDGKPFVLTGNYPYNISSQIFFKMLDYKDLIPCCTGMIQKEVAERIAAGPGSKTYGILSILIQAWYKVEYLFTVHEHVFNPPPKVKSAVIRMTRNETTELGCNEKLFKLIVKTTFNQRRKPLPRRCGFPRESAWLFPNRRLRSWLAPFCHFRRRLRVRCAGGWRQPRNAFENAPQRNRHSTLFALLRLA